jgi:hypothetical protein
MPRGDWLTIIDTNEAACATRAAFFDQSARALHDAIQRALDVSRP